MMAESTYDVVLGLGQTGLSVARYLYQHHKPFIVIDSRLQPPGLQQLREQMPEVVCHLGQFDVPELYGANEIIISPGIDLRLPEVKKARDLGISIVGDIELFARENTVPVVAVTGSNAKGTVVTLVTKMAQASGKRVLMGGNIGVPVLDLLREPTPELYVLELSSFQLETCYSLTSEVAVILNISPDHLDRYDSFADYVQAKQRIYRTANNLVINRQDSQAQPKQFSNRPSVSFGLDLPGAGEFGVRDVDGVAWLARGAEPLLPVSVLGIRGTHNWLNALAALAVGQACHLSMPAMLDTLKVFHGLKHRCQWVADIDGVAWFNDSKATNIGAATAAIEGIANQLNGKIVLLAGGLAKGADFSAMVAPVSAHVRQALLFGQDAKSMAEALSGATAIQRVADLAQAVSRAQEIAQPGDAVLLAPACASFDMFANYEARGDAFVDLVKEISHVT